MAPLEGRAAEWLAARREELNGRFVLARRRFPGLDAGTVGAWFTRLLPPFADGSPASGELLSVVYDLVLLHAGRGRLGNADSAATPLAALVADVFPVLRLRLAARPRVLVGALSNAVENLGDRGGAFVRQLADVVRDAETPEALLDSGALLAWRLGEARLRQSVLARAHGLPAVTVLRALGVGAYPLEAAPLLIASLEADAWIPPAAVFDDPTLQALPGLTTEAREVLLRRVVARGGAATTGWRLAASLGDFVGFGGAFEEPPICLTGGSRYRFRVMSTAGVFVLDADAFGCSCRVEADDDPGMKTASVTELPVAAKATSAFMLPDLVAYTTADSYRVKVAVPTRERL